MIEPRLIESFHMMWGTFPGPVLLIHKNRTILAVNEAAQTYGVPTGTKCFTLNRKEGHDSCRRCKANLALSTGKAVATKGTSDGKEVIGYWLPIRECDDVYVHLGVTPAEVGRQASAAELASL